ncbi:MAG TPA: hypothetical protein VFB79_04755, partial [Candidatus Angelobacter sp.]|nr:hypothetical protein [Candidatus Angelobacter sp.]
MLRASGIPADLALLSTGPEQDVNTELPGMGLFDHAIVYVPATGTEPETWIDATAQYYRVGDLPTMDYDRLALVVDESTTGLKKIPALTSTHNIYRETREFTLAEIGPAKIREINENTGIAEADYRDYYNGDAKRLHESTEKYVKSVYLADSLGGFEKTDASDLEKPFTVTFTAKGRRGYTDRENATVYIYTASLMEGLPEYFQTKEEAKKEGAEDKEDSQPKKPRRFDWEFNTFVHEWHYKIIAPPGYKLRALPADKEEQLASASYSQKFTANSDGTIAEAVFRFDAGKSRLTVEEAKKLRDAVVKAGEAEAIVISFDQTAYALLNQGKVKESLAAYQQLAALHPKEALHKIQLSRAYLSAGLGDRARAVAKEATIIEPNSAVAFGNLGWVMEHDLIGRRFGKGFDYQAAVAAYKKARQLDPKELDPEVKGTQVDYAILLEHDADGVRYSRKSHMEEAIAELKEVKKRDESLGKQYDDNVLYDLFYLQKFKDVIEQASALPGNDVHRGLILASITASQGIPAATKKSLEIAPDETTRTKAIANAGLLLVLLRKYQEAAEIYSLELNNQSNTGQMTAFINALRNTRHIDEIKINPAEPRDVVQAMLISTLDPETGYENALSFLSKDAKRDVDPARDKAVFHHAIYNVSKQAKTASLSLASLADIAVSNARFSTEGDSTLGYKATVEVFGGGTQYAYLVPENGQYKILHYSSSSAVPEELGWEVLARLDKNDLTGARKWLDWARESVHISSNDDPLSGQPFPHFWTKGQQGDADTIRL